MSTRKVYDCFTFFNELDLLEIRLNELKDVVDTFVICESTITFKGDPKDLILTDAMSMGKFKEFDIKVLIYDPDIAFDNAWDNERYQRNYLYEGIKHCNPQDVIILTDVDEIPSAERIARFSGPHIVTLEMVFSYYWVNNIMDQIWELPKIFTFEAMGNYTMNGIRNLRTEYFTANAGNHFSYLGGAEAIKLKIASFSHQEYNNSGYNTEELIQDKLNKNIDLFNRRCSYRIVPFEQLEICPQYLRDNADKYPDLIKPCVEARFIPFEGEKVKLPEVTLVIIDCVEYERALVSMTHCISGCEFGAVKILTSLDVHDKWVTQIPEIGSLEGYSKFVIEELHKYVDTEFVLIAQWDGFVLDPSKWNPDFLLYDYIGAPWVESKLAEGMPKQYNVGNGGFSLRSKRLQKFMADYKDKMYIHPRYEDVTIGQFNRAYLELVGFKFPTEELARSFSWESGPQLPSFGTHGRVKLNTNVIY